MRFIYVIVHENSIQQPIFIDHSPTSEDYNKIWAEFFAEVYGDDLIAERQLEHMKKRNPDHDMSDAIHVLQDLEENLTWGLFAIPEEVESEN